MSPNNCSLHLIYKRRQIACYTDSESVYASVRNSSVWFRFAVGNSTQQFANWLYSVYLPVWLPSTYLICS